MTTPDPDPDPGPVVLPLPLAPFDQPGPAGLPWDDPVALRAALDKIRARYPHGPNPRRVGACGRCGAYRADGRPPYLHEDWCPHHGDLQLDRFTRELAAGDLGGPPLTGEECP